MFVLPLPLTTFHGVVTEIRHRGHIVQVAVQQWALEVLPASGRRRRGGVKEDA